MIRHLYTLLLSRQQAEILVKIARHSDNIARHSDNIAIFFGRNLNEPSMGYSDFHCNRLWKMTIDH